MKVGWFLSMQIPSVPQRIDFKTYSGFTDGVISKLYSFELQQLVDKF